jgi:hypothetical protein
MPVSGGDQVDRDGCRTRPAHHAKIGRGLTEHHAEASSCAGRFAVQGCPVAVKGIPSNARRESKIFTLLPALSLSGKGPYLGAGISAFSVLGTGSDSHTHETLHV